MDASELWGVDLSLLGYEIAFLDQLFRMSSAQRLALGLRGRAIVEERYNMSAVAELWLGVYRSLLR